MLLEQLDGMPLAAAAAAPSDEDGVRTLLSMDDGPVRKKVGEAFVAQMQNAWRVRSAFFNPPLAMQVGSPGDQEDWIGQVASALIALSLSHTSGHGFAQTVEANAASSFLNTDLSPSNASFLAVARHNYAALFPAFCTTGGASPVAFQIFLSGACGPARHWGTALAAAMKRPQFIDTEMIKLNPGVDPDEWYQRFYANIYKVTCLNKDEVAGVLSTWDPYLKGRETADARRWTIYDHMVAGGYDFSTFFPQVLNAVNQHESRTVALGCHGASEGCTTETTDTYGRAVNDWLATNRGLGGFIKGPSNANVEIHTNGGSGCCFTPGTPILLADGTTRAIEEITQGQEVRSKDGAVFRRSAQDVHWQIADHDMLFGINDYDPFFNASHPFMTTAGWKSMSPRRSKALNPDLDIVGALGVGDLLLQVQSTDPFAYNEVRIDRITRMLARDAEDQRVYSLHLDLGNPGYHAHGFLVAVNYPNLREDHFVKAFHGITEAERHYLRAHFSAIAPFLRRGLGAYVSEILQRALGGAEDGEGYGAPLKVSILARD